MYNDTYHYDLTLNKYMNEWRGRQLYYAGMYKAETEVITVNFVCKCNNFHFAV